MFRNKDGEIFALVDALVKAIDGQWNWNEGEKLHWEIVKKAKKKGGKSS